MKTYTLETFDSRNTSTEQTISDQNLFQALDTAQLASTVNEFPIILSFGEYPKVSWVKYENGQKTEWSMDMENWFQALTS